MKQQGLREVRKVTERRDGCIYRTEHLHYAWVTFGKDISENNIVYCSLSTSEMKKLNYRTIRSVSDDAPDIVIQLA